MQGPCSSIQSHAIFVQGPCNSVQKKKLRHSCAGAMRQFSAEDKASGLCRERGHLFSLSRSTPVRNSHLRTNSRGFHRFAPREHHGRSFRRETWRSHVRGSLSSFTRRRPATRPSFGLGFGLRNPLPSLLSSGRHTPATVPAHHDVRAQPCVDCAAPLGELSALFPSHLRQEPRRFSLRGPLGAGPNFLTLSAAAMLPPALPRVGR